MRERKWSVNVGGAPTVGGHWRAEVTLRERPSSPWRHTVCARCLLTALPWLDLAPSKPVPGQEAGPPTHLRRAPVVGRVVQRPGDGCLVRQGRVLALHGGRVLVAIAPVVIASRVSTTH